jgi:hypothetical protein
MSETIHHTPSPIFQHTADLSRALLAENLTYTTFVILLAVHAAPGHRTSIVSLSEQTGYSYWAVRKQIERTPWIVIHRDSQLLEITLTQEATTKLAKIANRLS